MRAPFGLGDPEQLRALVTGAGFGHVEIRSSVGKVRFASPEHFLRYQVAASPLAGPVSQADDRSRQALMQMASTALQTFASADGFAFPIEGNVAVARKLPVAYRA